MKLRFTFIAIVLGTIPAYAERYSSGGEAFFVGALQGLFLMLVFWVWRFIKGNKSKSKENQQDERAQINLNKPISSEPKLTAWDTYKITNPEMAKAIGKISNVDVYGLSGKSISEIESSLKRMMNQYACQVSELKNVVVERFISRFSQEELHKVIVKLTEKSKIESQKYGIAKENTVSFYIQLWLNEHISRTRKSI